MSAIVDVYWSFRSPYSYLATPDMTRLGEDYEVDVALRPVLPLAVRSPSFFNPENQRRARYILLDWPRRAEMLGMAHAWPSPDPIVQDLETMEIAKEQPYIFRLTQLGVEAQRRGHGVAFAREVSHVIFGGTPDWHQGSHLAAAAARAGLDLASMDQALECGTHMAEIEDNQQALEGAGQWGVPTFVFRGEPFFGQDRVETLRWRLDREGLRREQ